MHKLIIFSLLTALGLSLNSYAQSNEQCPQHKSYRIAVAQAGPYIDFTQNFRQMVLHLQKAGLINNDKLIAKNFDLNNIEHYKELIALSQKGCLEFNRGSLYTGAWNERENYRLFTNLKRQIKEDKSFDMVWAFGTYAGQQMADESLDIPVLVISATSPDVAGIDKPGEFSSKANVHSQKEVDRHLTELTLFHQIFKFKNLGVLVDHSQEGKDTQSYGEIERFAQVAKVNIVPCYGNFVQAKAVIARKDYAQCLQQLAQKSDAVYLTLGHGADLNNYATQIKPLIDHKIPTFAQAGSQEVKLGALLSLAEDGMVNSGAFEAEVVKKIVMGKKPNEISQFYHGPLNLALNIDTARRIDWRPPFNVLISVDTVYRKAK